MSAPNQWPERINYPPDDRGLMRYERTRADAAISLLRAIESYCRRVKKASPVARSVLKLIGELPPP